MISGATSYQKFSIECSNPDGLLSHKFINESQISEPLHALQHSAHATYQLYTLHISYAPYTS